MLDICYIIGRWNGDVATQKIVTHLDSHILGLCMSYDLTVDSSSFGPIPIKKNKYIDRIFSCYVTNIDDLTDIIIEVRKDKDLFIRCLIHVTENNNIDNEEIVYCTHEFYKNLDSHFKKKYKKKQLNSVNEGLYNILSRNIIEYLVS
jgi:hypothetical protein